MFGFTESLGQLPESCQALLRRDLRVHPPRPEVRAQRALRQLMRLPQTLLYGRLQRMDPDQVLGPRALAHERGRRCCQPRPAHRRALPPPYRPSSMHIYEARYNAGFRVGGRYPGDPPTRRHRTVLPGQRGYPAEDRHRSSPYVSGAGLSRLQEAAALCGRVAWGPGGAGERELAPGMLPAPAHGREPAGLQGKTWDVYGVHDNGKGAEDAGSYGAVGSTAEAFGRRGPGMG